MPRPFVLALIFLCLIAAVSAVVRYDMPKAELLEELGKPTSTMKHPSGREVLLYPKGVRIELERGVVVSVKGMDLAAQEPGNATEAAAPESTAAPGEVPPTTEEKKDQAAAEAAEAADDARAEKEFADASAKARAEMEKTIERLENPQLDLPAAESSHDFDPTAFLLEVFVKWALMLAALKLTCKYWNADVEWSGLMLAAAADTGVRVVCSLVGRLLFDIDTLLFADEAIAAVVLLLVLRKVSTNRSLQQAVTITMTSKVFSVVVGSFLTTVILNLVH